MTEPTTAKGREAVRVLVWHRDSCAVWRIPRAEDCDCGLNETVAEIEAEARYGRHTRRYRQSLAKATPPKLNPALIGDIQKGGSHFRVTVSSFLSSPKPDECGCGKPWPHKGGEA